MKLTDEELELLLEWANHLTKVQHKSAGMQDYGGTILAYFSHTLQLDQLEEDARAEAARKVQSIYGKLNRHEKTVPNRIDDFEQFVKDYLMPSSPLNDDEIQQFLTLLTSDIELYQYSKTLHEIHLGDFQPSFSNRFKFWRTEQESQPPIIQKMQQCQRALQHLTPGTNEYTTIVQSMRAYLDANPQTLPQNHHFQSSLKQLQSAVDDYLHAVHASQQQLKRS